MSHTVDLPQLFTRAALGSIDKEARTVDVIFSTGAAVDRYDYKTGRTYAETLGLKPGNVRLERFNSGASVLDTHSSWSLSSVIGAVVPGSAKLAGGIGTCKVRFSRRDDVEPFWQDVIDGIIRFVSVGYIVHKFEEADNPPTRRAIDWEPYEVSFVPMPADAGAQTRGQQAAQLYPCVIERAATAGERPTMPKTNQPENAAEPAVSAAPAAEPVAARAADPVATSAAAAAAPAPAAAVPAPPAQVRYATAAEVRDLVTAAGGNSDQTVEILARGQMTIEQVRGAVLDTLIARQAAAPVSTIVRMGEDARDKFVRGAVNWLLIKSGAETLMRAAKMIGPEPVDAGEFRGMTLLDLAREALERRGVKTRGMDKMALAGAAFSHRDVSIMQSTGDFPILLENVLHKILQAAYSTVEDTWTKFAKRSTVSDFRAHPRYRMGMFGALDALTENGEFKTKAINDAEKASITAATKGNIVNVSRQMVINDDLGALTSLLSMLGRAAALSIEVDVFSLLLQNSGLGPTQSDSQPLFHSNRTNVGTGAAFSVNALDADRQVLASQKDPWGNEFLALRPAVLLVPLSLGGQARVTNQSQYDVDATSKFQVPNKVAGLFREVVDTPRLPGTRRYMFADPNVAPVFEVAFLEGQEAPVLEARDGWRQDGTEMRVRFDYGTAATDYRGAVTNAGV